MASSRQQATAPNPAATQFQQGHPSRRDNHSVSSTHSSRSTKSSPHPAVESAVTRLLVAIKQLLESLTLWSTLKISETEVSDVYVRLGNGFNEAVAAFAAFNIDMVELMNVPEDLRHVLEQCLAEDASPENLELYLPTVRSIITNLLQGLRGKQSTYRQIVSSSRQRSDQSGQERESTRSSRSGGSRGHRSQLSRTIAENEGAMERGSVGRRSVQSSGRRKAPENVAEPQPVPADGPFVGGFVPTRERVPSPVPSPGSSTKSDPRSKSQSQAHSRRRVSSPRRSGTADFPFTTLRADPSKDDDSFENMPAVRATMMEQEEQDQLQPLPSPPLPQVPASVKRYSLVDRPAPPPSPPPPAVIIDSPPTAGYNHDTNGTGSSPPQTPPLDSLQLPAMANSLAALKKSDALERRASKRFSTYNISKMTGSTRERSVRGHPNRRSLVASNAPLTAGELAVLTEVDDEEDPPELQRYGSSGGRRPRSTTPIREEETPPPIPPLPVSISTSTPELAESLGDVASAHLTAPKAAVQSSARSSGTSFTVFLQLGREVKKVTMEPGLSFSSLRVMFVDKFSYNPGLENFPAIYIRDPSSGVQYELEDVDEVKEKCLLSLNIEPLDQIKQHIDSQISTLSQDIKELRTAVTARPNQMPAIIAQPLSESPTVNRPTDRTFQHVARRISRLIGEASGPPIPVQPQMTGQAALQAQMTGNSVLSEYSNRVVTDLKTQFDEVQNLRRDLGIMRQLYTEFMKSTKDSLGVLRTQTKSVKQLATTSVGGARGYIESGKAQLDMRTQNVLTKVEELQDTVEGVKDDVLKRNITPKPALFRSIKEDIAKVTTELKSLNDHIKTVTPMWKKTWEEELQNLIEEQQFLNHQEEFVNDLLEDHKAVLEIYGHVEKVISIRGSGSGRKPGLRTYTPRQAEEGHNGLSTVMLEIRGAAVDPDKRMKAIAANQKNREKELANKADEFQEELFVGAKKLKMTGGAEEAERVRQRKNEMTLKAMFTGDETLPFNPDATSTPMPLQQ